MNINMNSHISDLARMASKASGASHAGVIEKDQDFGRLLNEAVANVNGAMVEADSMKSRFESGANDLSLSDVMIASQKANISFQAMLQVRNKLVSAYQEIMNMQI